MGGKLRIIISIIVLTILVLFAAFVWPTLYRYERFLNTTARINRLTGSADILTYSGWENITKQKEQDKSQTLPPPPAPEKPMKPYLSQEEAQKLGLENKPVPVPPEDLPDNLKQ